MKTGVAFMCAAAVAAMSGVEAFAPVPVQRNLAFASRSSGSALQAKYNNMDEILALFPEDKPVLINFLWCQDRRCHQGWHLQGQDASRRPLYRLLHQAARLSRTCQALGCRPKISLLYPLQGRSPSRTFLWRNALFGNHRQGRKVLQRLISPL